MVSHTDFPKILIMQYITLVPLVLCFSWGLSCKTVVPLWKSGPYPPTPLMPLEFHSSSPSLPPILECQVAFWNHPFV